MPVQVIRDSVDLDRLEADWDRLAAATPTRSFAWAKAWWNSFREGNLLHVVIVTSADGAVVGIAPWFLCRRFGLTTLKFLGCGKVCSDYLRVLVQPGYESLVESELTEVVDAFSKSAFFCGLELDGMRADTSQQSALPGRFDSARYECKTKPLESAWQVELPDKWESYLPTLNSSFRRKVRKCLERVDCGEIQAHVVNSAGESDRGFEILVQLHRARRESIGESGCFADPRFYNFLKEAIPAMLNKSQARIAWLECEGKPIGAALLLTGPAYVGMYQSGLEPSAIALEPGHTLAGFLVRDAVRCGVKTFDFMRGDEAYKSLWRAKPIALSKTRFLPRSRIALGLSQAESSARFLQAQFRQICAAASFKRIFGVQDRRLDPKTVS
jgi:CelD/BcsL family acetyltransferase involved in cellulose biosynthesis